MKFIDMFCGIGTIRMGMEQAGHECVYSIEWDKHKRGIYNVIFGKEPEGQDIRECRGIEFPRADCWCFGAPCQDFSIAGSRAGLEGDRSCLVREVFRLLREIEEEYRPKWLLYENVKGMLSSNKGFDYLEILAEMASLGYDTIEYGLLNSKDFGVPQNRERVFTIGHLRGRSTREIFPIGTSNESSIKQIGNCMAHGKRENPNQGRVYDINGISPTLSKMEGGGRQPHILVNRVIGSMQKNAYIGDGSICPTLTRAMGEGGGQIPMIERKDLRIRRLTPKECWRLQGISDNITDKVIQAGISDTQMYRAAGDACTVNVIYEIAKHMS